MLETKVCRNGGAMVHVIDDGTENGDLIWSPTLKQYYINQVDP